MDSDARMTFINPQMASMLGYTIEEMLGQKLELFLAADQLSDHHEQMKIRAQGENAVYERCFRKKDGGNLWVLISANAIIDSEGKLAGSFGMLTDITERKRAEESLVKLAEKFRLITENMVDCVALMDASGTYQYTTPSYRETLGYDPEEMIGIKGFSLIHPDDVELVFKLYIESIEQGLREISYETRLRHKDGHYVPIEIRVRSLNDQQGKIIGGVLAARDITKRLQLEQERQVAEEESRRLASVVLHSRELVNLATPNGTMFFLNDAGKKMLGIPEEDVAQTNIMQVIPENLRDKVRQEVLPAISMDGFWEGDLQYLNLKTGVLTDVHAITYKITDPNTGELQFMANVSLDITARKKAEEAQRILEERLQQADKMEAIGTLAGGIAHDFNNLLMGIQGYASMILLNLDTSNPNYERLKRIEQQVQSGADLTSQLLGFARGGRYEVKPTNMNEIIEKTSSMFGRTKKEISINRKSAKDLWNVEVDRGQMEQVFLNLYVNAWQAMPGGGDIYLETQNALLNDEQTLPYSVNPGKYVKITITDTGKGMDEKTKERIFDPFFTTKEMGRGTGLGLATVYGIIKGHHGMINVYSEPAHGTTFTIYLPATDKEISKEKAPTEEIVTGTETILLVEDEKMVMEVNKELLESMGYTVYVAGSGQEGIAVYMEKRDKIDLIVLDMIMPGISGSETFDRLRKINPNIKVLLSSGYSLNGKAQEIMDRGCNGFLQKPFKLEELSSKVREMLN